MSLRSLPTMFTFGVRDALVFSDENLIRMDETLNNKEGAATLKAPVSQADDIYVASEVLQAMSVQQWRGFEVDAEIDADLGQSINFRLNDGADHYYWDGSAWAVTTTEWNTSTVINANIGTFPITSKKLGVVANLKTTSTLGPTLRSVSIIMDADFDYYDDIIFRSLVPYFKNIRFDLDFAYKMTATSATIDTANIRFDTPWQIQGVRHAYNLTEDPDRRVDLYSSYSAGVLTMTEAQDPPSQIAIVFSVEPYVKFASVSQDYIEVEKTPTIIIRDTGVNGTWIHKRTFVRDIAAKTAVTARDPHNETMTFKAEIIAESNVTLLRLSEAMFRYLVNNPSLTSRATGDKYDLIMNRELSYTGIPNPSDLREGSLNFAVKNIPMYVLDAVETPLVTNAPLVTITQMD